MVSYVFCGLGDRVLSVQYHAVRVPSVATAVPPIVYPLMRQYTTLPAKNAKLRTLLVVFRPSFAYNIPLCMAANAQTTSDASSAVHASKKALHLSI
jgi:hypothetical protein